ncbi:LysR substrate-binding domain-containing protein [Sorangium sp. So ce834]|uniref:LysR substrate-binding domain-containing protein n=1 Tax=Sorangium sp. So ce834 TaxID=3133321 RepID=UPI003F637D2B
MPKGHRLAKRRALRIADLENERFFWTRRLVSPPLYDAVVSAFGARGRSLVIHEEDDVEPLLTLVASGEGLTFFSERAAQGAGARRAHASRFGAPRHETVVAGAATRCAEHERAASSLVTRRQFSARMKAYHVHGIRSAAPPRTSGRARLGDVQARGLYLSCGGNL